ncbi:DMT family transporter [Aquibium oceanicum]|uniref:EamA family transporter n=1 Tax=Aquibium oceanicum TaxID=1670800 RepID=A0A1L3STI9_9HYPH|nr:EamA family transporter [Aquibium oceanicum]
MSAVAHGLDRRDAIDTAAALLMIGLTFSWGLNGVAVKLANDGFSPVLISIARSSIAALCVFAWCRWRGIALFERDGTLGAGLLAGALFGIEFVLIFWGLDFTTVARSALMINTMPFWVLLGAHFMLGERMSLLKLVGTALAFGGVALVFSDRLSLPDPEALKGDAMCLAAGIAWAATIIVIKRSKLSSASAEKTLLYQLAVSAVITVPLLAVSGPAIRDPDAVSTSALLFQAVFIVAFTYLLWFWLMRRYPAGGLSSFAFLTPAFGVLMGGLLLDEPLSLRIFIALGLIAVGLVIVNRPARRIPPA